MPEAETESFVTVSEAARALSVDARQVRRWVDRLSDSDKSSDTSRKYRGVPIVTVRMSALLALQSETLSHSADEKENTLDSDIRTGQQFGKTERPVRTSQRPNVPMSENGAGLREIIERQDAEIKRLSDALQREQENTAAAQRLVDQSQQLQLLVERRAAALENEVEKLKALPAVEQERPSGLAGGDSGDVSASLGAIPLPESPEAQKTGFWARLWGRG
jgi:transposase-like protein